MEVHAVEALIKEKIPITQHLGFSIEGWDGKRLRLRAPFSMNKNHHHTAFGGSLAMASIVSGYAMTFMALHDAMGEAWLETCTLVIRDFACSYRRPVRTDLLTVSYPVGAQIPVFIQNLTDDDKARLYVETLIQTDAQVLLKCHATYVAYRSTAQ